MPGICSWRSHSPRDMTLFQWLGVSQYSLTRYAATWIWSLSTCLSKPVAASTSVTSGTP